MALRLRVFTALVEDPWPNQHSHGSSQPSITPVAGDLIPSSACVRLLYSCGTHKYTQAHMHTQTHTLTYT